MLKDCMSQDISRLLINWNNGDKAALDQLMPLVYNELYRLANKRFGLERANHTLQATALINEAYLRLVKVDSVNWQNRAHFFAVAAQVMRNILVDHARKQMADKRINPKDRLSLDSLADQPQNQKLDLMALDDALKALAVFDEQKSRIIELRFFGGLTLEETAEVLQLSSKTIQREWDSAKLWLLRELKRNGQ
jgi:RNA polymerase sigma factor (TIGR02999 family)